MATSHTRRVAPGFGFTLLALLNMVLWSYVSPRHALGQAILAEPPQSPAVCDAIADSFRIGQRLPNPRTLQASSLDELVEWTAGSPRRKAVETYAGKFNEYWPKAQSTFSGKTFEALEVWKENKRLASLGDERRFVVTAAEKHGDAAHHSADVVLTDRYNRIIDRFQFKMGYRGTLQALKDPKYRQMKIVTTRESLDLIKRQISRKRLGAARRGVGLGAEWTRVQRSLEEGRLVGKWPSGAVISSRSEVKLVAKSVVESRWTSLARATGRSFPPSMPPLAGATKIVAVESTGRAVGKVMGRGMVIVDVSANVYLSYVDYGRWRSHEISGHYFGFKVVLRSAQSMLTVVAAGNAIAPEPVVTKSIAIVAAAGSGILVIVDIISDPIYEAAEARRRHMLALLERTERHSHCRSLILEQMHKSLKRADVKPSDPARASDSASPVIWTGDGVRPK